MAAHGLLDQAARDLNGSLWRTAASAIVCKARQDQRQNRLTVDGGVHEIAPRHLSQPDRELQRTGWFSRSGFLSNLHSLVGSLSLKPDKVTSDVPGALKAYRRLDCHCICDFLGDRTSDLGPPGSAK